MTASDVYVAGATLSADFPGTAGGAQAVKVCSSNPCADVFVARLNLGLTSLVQATYLGGAGDDVATAIAVTASDVYVAGYTSSTDFPGTSSGAQSVPGGGNNDAFVARLNLGLTALAQATYLGGAGDDIAVAIAATTSDVYVTGATSSTNFTGTTGGAQSVHGGGNNDAFVARLNLGLTALAQ